MAAHTQIIDLYGIPACGKTTLAKYKASHPADGLKVATMRDCKIAALNDKWHLFLSITPKNLWQALGSNYLPLWIKSGETFRLRMFFSWESSKTMYVNTQNMTLS